ncbi:MAG: cytochrome b/b6 domain-containing protein [Notoacmeibacter sp.]|nr:cytochrome b/b6 domain-containing protein [Notoacmeibacter sp.]MCC0032205.1 cytochrome b/b6 domain-containing protein [Brucellaceae bacterium]
MTNLTPDATGTLDPSPSDPGSIRVWDGFVRLFHWSLVALFAFAFATGDEWQKPHELAGYVIAGLVAARIVWGFAGPAHARFRDFVHRPGTIFRFLMDSLAMKARRYIGHNPAGGAMVLALLTMLIVISGSGYAMTTDMFWGVKWVEELHEATVYLTLGLIVLHVAGVILASIEHSENLVRSMITGRKRAG